MVQFSSDRHTRGQARPDSGERLIRAVAALSLAFSLVYIVWRWGWTLNTEALWFSVPFAIAETYGLVTAFFMTFTAWRLKTRTVGKAPARKKVDVYVTTYDEPLTIIRKTALAAREIRYPHKTYILDDGRRDEIMALADELGIGYIRRQDNQHAKAGNLNNALKNTKGDFILQLDADHVPLPQIIDRLLPFFQDEEVAFVQSPQDFYNRDAFTYDVNERARRIWEDQQLFFRVLQPGKDSVGAAFFVGSCALLRRKALQDVGGFATTTITEDIETSLLLHARGWKSVFWNETLAYGLAPASATAFHVQHLRWGQGAMQALRKYRPLSMRGLTISQRIAYFDSLSTYLGGFQRLILYMAPLAFFFTGAFPLRASALEFAAIFVPYITLQIVSFKLLARGHGSLLLADRYAMAKFFTHMLAVTGYLRRKPLKFKVTPKGKADVPFGTYAPQATLIAVTIVAVVFGSLTHLRGDEYIVPGWGQLAFWVNLVFALWNASVAAYIVRMCLRIKQNRADYRFAESMPVTVRLFRLDGKLTAVELAVTENLNPYGISIRSMHPLSRAERVELDLPLSAGEVAVRGRIVHSRTEDTEYGTVHVHGIEFTDLDLATRDTIELHCAHHAAPLDRQRYEESGGSTIAETFRRLRDLRKDKRIQVGMPARVFVGNNGQQREIGYGLLEEVSSTGARLLISHPIAPDSFIRVEIPNSNIAAEGQTVFVHALETSVGVRFIVGIDTRPVIAVTPESVQQRLAWVQYVRDVAGRYREAAGEAAGRYRDAAVRYRDVATTAARSMWAARPRRMPAKIITMPEPELTVAAPVVVTPTVTQPSVTWLSEPTTINQITQPRREEIMERHAIPIQDYTRSFEPETRAKDNSLMVIRGNAARLEGKFSIADSIEVECEVNGELEVGGKLVIGEQGRVTADVNTVDAVIRGSFSGTMHASGSVEIAATGRVSGSLYTSELIIAKGAAFTGTVERIEKSLPAAASPLVAEVQALNTDKQVVTLAADPTQLR